MSAPTPRRTVVQTPEQFEELRSMLIPWTPEDADRLPRPSLEYDDQSTNMSFRTTKAVRRECTELAARYGLTLSDFMRRLVYATLAEYTELGGPAVSVPSDREAA